MSLFGSFFVFANRKTEKNRKKQKKSLTLLILYDRINCNQKQWHNYQKNYIKKRSRRT